MSKERTALTKIPFFIGLIVLSVSIALTVVNLSSSVPRLNDKKFDSTSFRKETLPSSEIKKGNSLAALLIEKSPNPILSPKKTKKVAVKFQNIGRETWERSGPHPVQLGLLPPKRRSSVFHANDWISIDRPAKLEEKRVMSGEVGTFSFYLRGPTALEVGAPQPGLYNEQMGLVKEGGAWFDEQGGGVDWQVFLKPSRLFSVSTIFPQFYSEFRYRFDIKPIIAFNLLVFGLIFIAFSWANLYLRKVFPRPREPSSWKTSWGPINIPVFSWRFYVVLGGLSLLILGFLFLFLTVFIYQESHEVVTTEFTMRLAFFFLIGATLFVSFAWLRYPSTKSKNSVKK